jgi:glycosyltransferase involved in cell wall biosynthesis
MNFSLIVTTYNWEPALRLTLLSAMRQVRLPDEILVADDGSRAETANLVEQMRADCPIPLQHIWQEDLGFRVGASRNRAIAAARGDYIVLVDGDVILDTHYTEDHCAVARRGRFVQGRRTYIGRQKTHRILRNGDWNLHPLAGDLSNRKNAIRSLWLSRLLSRTSTSLRGTLACNMAFWRDDAIAVNGFNEAITGWGREDSEFVVRLLNRGLQRRLLRHRAVMYHLYHTINSRDSIPQNDRLLFESQRTGCTWCERGLDQHLATPPDTVPYARAA